ncbi:hypothetical protein NQ314_020260 [Rhamnusium bicolor]|uniref:DDE Tnp4 domain-containing protein n=1 Tax=Rhamnusium bicolor TaxID=1586634 RepID=A0AAV8WM37_9CUCU|nr:hypothetical protein NQ314_020260 [Rhamnusium bicolor]
MFLLASLAALHNARVFWNSPLFGRLTDEVNPLLPPEYHIIGEAAYPLKTYLMTPFSDTGYLDHSQTTYNVCFSYVQSITKRVFASLEEKFRRLKCLDVVDLELANNIITAACVLHNFISDHNDVSGLEEEEDIYDENDDRGNTELAVDESAGGAAAIQKRNTIVNVLHKASK